MKNFLLIILLSFNVLAANFTEEKEYQPEIVKGYCQIKEVTIVKKDGVQISESNHRWAIEPNGDLTPFNDYVKNICKAAWTKEVIEQFKLQKIKNNSLIGR